MPVFGIKEWKNHSTVAHKLVQYFVYMHIAVLPSCVSSLLSTFRLFQAFLGCVECFFPLCQAFFSYAEPFSALPSIFLPRLSLVSFAKHFSSVLSISQFFRAFFGHAEKNENSVEKCWKFGHRTTEAKVWGDFQDTAWLSIRAWNVEFEKGFRRCIWTLFLPHGVEIELIFWSTGSRFRDTGQFKKIHIWARSLKFEDRSQSCIWTRFLPHGVEFKLAYIFALRTAIFEIFNIWAWNLEFEERSAKLHMYSLSTVGGSKLSLFSLYGQPLVWLFRLISGDHHQGFLLSWAFTIQKSLKALWEANFEISWCPAREQTKIRNNKTAKSVLARRSKKKPADEEASWLFLSFRWSVGA